MLKAILEISMTLFLILMLILMLVGVIGITITAFSERDEDEGDEEKMNDWNEIKIIVLEIANKFSYMEELANIILKTKIVDSRDKSLYKKWIIDAHYELNHQLTIYINYVFTRMRINCAMELIYYGFYQYVFDSANEIKKAVFYYLDTDGTEIVDISDYHNDEMLGDIICEINHHIKDEKEVN